MSLQPPEKTRKLQEALRAKAKGAPNYRFYLLYDKLYREDVLTFAYRRCKANGGAAGVDDQRFEDIEAYGVKRLTGDNYHFSGGSSHCRRSSRRLLLYCRPGR